MRRHVFEIHAVEKEENISAVQSHMFEIQTHCHVLCLFHCCLMPKGGGG